MGFMKKFFSLGSKKSRKTSKHMQEIPTREYSSMPNRATTSVIALSVPIPEEPELRRKRAKEEADANYLLRSSSMHFKVVSEYDYSTMPPLPHPINRLVTGSTLSLISTATSTAKPAYTVKVHPKTVLTEAEFSDKSYSSEVADTSLLHRLRADPSVVSLLNMYDNHGKLPDEAFADNSLAGPSVPSSPSTTEESIALVGRVQSKRSGSTLRQLLGEPDQTDGEISWAERHLHERDSETSSLDSSVGLKTPTEPSARFVDDNVSCMTSHIDTPHDSLEQTIDNSSANVSEECIEPKMPPASEVFAFITNKARSSRMPSNSSLRHSSPPLLFVRNQSDFSTESPSLPSPSNAHSSLSSNSFNSDTDSILRSVISTHEPYVLHDKTKGPNSLPQTTPASPQPAPQDKSNLPKPAVTITTSGTPSRIPRASRSSLPPALTELSANVERGRIPDLHDMFSPLPMPTKATRSKHWPRRASGQRKAIPSTDKENAATFADSMGLHVAPSKLVRPNTSQSLKRLSDGSSSPSTSAELSPVGQQLMREVRAQKASTRTEGGRHGPSRSH